MTGLLLKCPTCRERFELELDDRGAMWGRSFRYAWHPCAPRWFPRTRAVFRMLLSFVLGRKP